MQAQTPEQFRDQAATLALSLVLEDMASDYCPTAELIRTIAQFNSDIAAFLRRHGLACDEQGRVYSTGYQPPTG